MIGYSSVIISLRLLCYRSLWWLADSAIGPLCMCVSVCLSVCPYADDKFEQNGFLSIYVALWLIVTLSRSSSRSGP